MGGVVVLMVVDWLLGVCLLCWDVALWLIAVCMFDLCWVLCDYCLGLQVGFG